MSAEAKITAYVTLNEEGDPAMLFFDRAEAVTYCEEGEEPIEMVQRAELDRFRAKTAEIIAAANAQVEDYAKQREEMRAEVEGLREAIDAHNADCIQQCESRKEAGPSHCPMRGYDRECGDCPRDGMLNLSGPKGQGSGDLTRGGGEI